MTEIPKPMWTAPKDRLIIVRNTISWFYSRWNGSYWRALYYPTDELMVELRPHPTHWIEFDGIHEYSKLDAYLGYNNP